MNVSLAPRLDDITAPLAELHWPPGRVLCNRYRIGRVLEFGGMATVYEATQLDLVRRVAIKTPTIECATDPGCARRFEREARTLAALQHPNIVAVIELGKSEEGIAFMAMELVEGSTLRAHLAADGVLPWRVAAVIGAQLADALEFAHASGVVHGDVSAANVLLVRRGEIFTSKLIDFGAARKIGDGDLPHRTYGTTRYVAPELFAGEAPHIASDLFALGAVLKEMLGEATPGTVPELLQQLIASLLDADPQARPESAAEVVLFLRGMLVPEVVATSPCVAPPVRAAATPMSISTPSMRADPRDALRRAPRLAAAPRAASGPHVRSRWIAAGVAGAAALCAFLTYLHYRTSSSAEPASTAVVALQDMPVGAKTVAAGALIAPAQPPAPATALPRARPAVAAAATPSRKSVPVRVAVQGPAPKAVATPATNPSDYELHRDESLERVEIVAALDRWFAARNRNVSRERVPVMAMRVGEPSITFDPSGTSASVTYRKRLVYSRSNRLEQSIIEEQVFFTKPGDVWQMIDSL